MDIDKHFTEKTQRAFAEMPTLEQGKALPDDKAQQAEVADDTAGAIELLTLERDNLEIDIHDALILVAKLNEEVETEHGGDEVVSRFLEQHGVKDGKPPEQLREFVTKHRQQLDQKTDDANRHWADLKAEQVRCIEAEKALKLLHEESPGVAVAAVDLCCMCPAADHCGPKFPDSEPCKEFAAAEARHEKLAPVRKVLERMKG